MEIETVIRGFVIRQLLGEDESSVLDSNAALFTSGLLDSINKMKLISFLERQFGIEIEASEATADHLETLTAITAFVRRKMAKVPG